MPSVRLVSGSLVADGEMNDMSIELEEVPNRDSMEDRFLEIEEAAGLPEPQPATDSSNADRAAAPTHPTPVPVQTLMRKNFEPRKQAQKAMNAKLLPVGGKLHLRLRPSAESTCVMAVVGPMLLCLPCFLDVSSDVTFDDHSEQVTVRSWPGYLRCLQRTRRFAYREIANVVIIRTHQSRGSQRSPRAVYQLCLVLRDRTEVCLMLDEIGGVKALAVQVRAQ